MENTYRTAYSVKDDIEIILFEDLGHVFLGVVNGLVMAKIVSKHFES